MEKKKTAAPQNAPRRRRGCPRAGQPTASAADVTTGMAAAMSENPIEAARVPPDCEAVSPAVQKSPPAVSVQVHPKPVHVPMSPQTIPSRVQNTAMSQETEQDNGSLFSTPEYCGAVLRSSTQRCPSTSAKRYVSTRVRGCTPHGLARLLISFVSVLGTAVIYRESYQNKLSFDGMPIVVADIMWMPIVVADIMIRTSHYYWPIYLVSSSGFDCTYKQVSPGLSRCHM